MRRNKIIPYNSYLKEKARILRTNSTLSEILLWNEIKKRKLGVQFHRQVPIDRYIVDFYCHELKIAIEVNGSTHDNPISYQKDKKRENILNNLGVTIIHIDDVDIKSDLESVLNYLNQMLK
ncbi:MAG: endonuclease domain-containing protein [Balneolaceae bacterium]